MTSPDFDGSCIGRPSSPVTAAMMAYKMIENEYSAQQLNRFNLFGYDSQLDSGQNGSGCLAVWRGFHNLERALLGVLNLSKPSWLLEYGITTSACFNTVLNALSGKGWRCLWTDELYAPWAVELADADALGKIHGIRFSIRQHIANARETTPENLANIIAAAIYRQKPNVVFLSVVTRGGVRIPVESILGKVKAWATSNGCTAPLFVFDGCQAYGRVPTDCASSDFTDIEFAYIGCLHKILHGPKEMAFVIASSPSLRKEIEHVRSQSADRNNMVLYARTKGRAPGLPTIDCANAIGASAALSEVDFSSVRSDFASILLRGAVLRVGLEDTRWRVLTPADAQWESGILLLDAPAPIAERLCNGFSANLDVPMDVLRGRVRVAFDRFHTEESVSVLIKQLRELDE